MSKTIQVDTKTFVRFWLVILAFVAVALFIKNAAVGLIIVGIAAFLAIAIQPLARRIGKWLDMPGSTFASVSAYVIVMAILFLAIAVVGPVVVGETARFVGQLPETFENTLGGWDGINNFGQSLGIENLQGEIASGLQGISSGLVGNLGGVVANGIGIVGNVATGTILVMVLTILFLLEGPALMDGFWKLMRSRDAHKNKGVTVARGIVTRMKDVVATYMSRQVAVALLDGCVVTLAVFVLSLIFGFSSGLAIPMGVTTAICYLIPMFGPIIGCVLVSLILLFSNPWAGLVFAVFYIVYAQIEANVIAPKVQGDALKLQPLVILVAVTLGIYMFGLIGAIIAIPIAGCIKVLIEEYPKIKELRED